MACLVAGETRSFFLIGPLALVGESAGAVWRRRDIVARVRGWAVAAAKNHEEVLAFRGAARAKPDTWRSVHKFDGADGRNHLYLPRATMKNIVLILLDDLGFNDVSFHGSPQIQTPNMDEIAHTGVKLFNYHANLSALPLATLLSGRHAIHHGIYMPFARGSNLRLNLSYTLLPAALANLGYESHAVGKWHLGQNELAALPTGRGFDSFYGYWTGAETHFSHFATRAYDFADQTETCLSVNGTYGTRLFAKRAVEIIEGAKASRPFFPIPRASECPLAIGGAG